MAGLNLAKCRKIVRAAFAKGKELDMQPLSVVVLDTGGNVLAFEKQDGAAPGGFHVADGKANAAVKMGVPSSKMMERAEQQVYLTDALNGAYGGRFVPVPGGVLVKDKKGAIMGAVGVSGDTSENDVLCAIAGIEAATFTAEG
ncbi:heme-binding protein [Amylibacter sp. IMCC11727]|uniref:GlcG/HbpS family heme-binding protein n=1 Tax=Amylibacter sp. IMCC11727 TaxID=3039851 RepID=UPI00244E1097|nr:heme-binding protein [Amylibacter sp. IMCC11727]WGI21049.1 heme-binding protein [Amylibacter sp. IMCC11727]